MHIFGRGAYGVYPQCDCSMKYVMAEFCGQGRKVRVVRNGICGHILKLSVGSARGLDLCACVGSVAILVGCRWTYLVGRPSTTKIQWKNCGEVLCSASVEQRVRGRYTKRWGFCWGLSATLLCRSRIDTP